MAIRSCGDYRRQRLETQALEEPLRRIEQGEHQVIARIGGPDDLNPIADRLLLQQQGRRAERVRANAALMALLFVREPRTHFGG